MSGKGNAWMKLDHTSIDWVIVTYRFAVSEKIIATTQSTSRTTLKVAKVIVSIWEKPVLEYNFITRALTHAIKLSSSNYENTKSSCELLVRDGISKQSAYGLADKNFCTEPKMVSFNFNSIGGVVKSDNYDNGDVVSPLMCWAHQTTCKEAIGA